MKIDISEIRAVLNLILDHIEQDINGLRLK
jgi:hypothetical protein